ncbi:MAG TPA: oxidoreductase, partial [Hyalangium sp.]|nr:oxidoreductase [Hyalangium sp.]
MKNTERAPMPPDAAPPTTLSLDEVRRCTVFLEAMVEDRSLLARLPAPDRIALLTAAGRVLHQDQHAKTQFVKAQRRDRKQAKREN